MSKHQNDQKNFQEVENNRNKKQRNTILKVTITKTYTNVNLHIIELVCLNLKI